MLPQGSDNFVIADFDDTFTRLDNAPGVTPVASYAALTVLGGTLGTAQHGSLYLTKDNFGLWMWNRPTSAAGTFVKINTRGQLASASMTIPASTSANSDLTGFTLLTTTFVAPGGRNVYAFFSHPEVTNSGSFGASSVSMWLDNGIVERSIAYSGSPTQPVSHRLFQACGVLDPGSSHTIKVTMAAHSTAGGATTTSATASGQLYVWEV